MNNRKPLSEDRKKKIDKLRMEYAEELKRQFGKYVILENGNIKFPSTTLSKIKEIIDLDESTISRQLKSPYSMDSRPPNIITMNQSIAKIRAVNLFEIKVNNKHKKEIDTLKKRITELENIIKSKDIEIILKTKTKLIYEPTLKKLEEKTNNLRGEVSMLFDEIQSIKKEVL